jgi:hypothetical protein
MKPIGRAMSALSLANVFGLNYLKNIKIMIHNQSDSFDSVERGIGSDIQEIQRINESKIRTLESELQSLLKLIEALEKTIQELEIRLNVLKSEPNSDGLTQLRSRLQKELDKEKRGRLEKIREVLDLEMEYSNLEIHVKANHDAQLYKPRNLTRKQLNDAFLNDSNSTRDILNKEIKDHKYMAKVFNHKDTISRYEREKLEIFKLQSKVNFIDNYFKDNRSREENSSIFSKIISLFS